MKNWIICLMVFITFNQVKAQSFVDSWRKKYSNYYSALSGHKIHVTFNQHKYVAGDTSFFAIQLFENELTRVKPKRILDFHLIDSEGKSVHHFLLSILNGEGFNQWIVPDLPAGVYRVAIHHYGLKSFNPEVIFQRPLEIVKAGVLQPVSPPVRVSVEGGHLISSIENRLLISTIASVNVKLLDSSGSLVINGFAGQDGFCAFKFKPLPSKRYFVKAGNDSTLISLPVVEPDGVGLTVQPLTDKGIRVASIKTLSKSKFKNERVTLVITQRDQFLDAIEIFLSNDSMEVNLQTAKWREGLIHLAILRSSGEQLAYRNLYHRTQTESSAKIKTSKLVYQPREKVEVSLEFLDSIATLPSGSYSVSVISNHINHAQSFDPRFDPSFDVDFANEDFAWNELLLSNTVTLDNHVLTRSKPQPWGLILSNNDPSKGFKFKGNIQSTGKAFSNAHNKPAINGTNLLVYLQRSHHRYQLTITDGLVLMPMLDFFGSDELLVMAETQAYLGGETIGQVLPDFWVKWNIDSIKWPGALKFRETIKSDPYAVYASQNRLIRNSFDAYLVQKNSMEKFDDHTRDFPSADLTVKVTDYEPFRDMEELIREIIPSLQHRKTRKGPIVLVSLPTPLKITGDPTYIIDGFATKNTSYFMSLKPSDLSTVSIVSSPKKLIPLGLFGKNGLVLVKTIKGNARVPNNQSTQIEGLSKPLLFGGQQLAKIEEAPYFNSCVYWQPLSRIDENGKAAFSFITSDDLGPYQIVVSGISKTGIPFSSTAEINVNLPTK